MWAQIQVLSDEDDTVELHWLSFGSQLVQGREDKSSDFFHCWRNVP